MATLNLKISKLHFPGNASIPNQIYASFYIRPYYPANGAYTLMQSGVLIDTDGTVLGSPPPTAAIDPTQTYMIKAVNETCDFVYEQAVSVNPSCPVGYQLSQDGTYCYYTVTTSATPPTAPQNSVAVNYSDYSVWGSLIYNQGFNVNGTGTFTQIPYFYTFWLNGTGGYPTGTGANTTLGPLNRTGLWTATPGSGQQIGYSVCLNAPVTGLYYVGIAADNYASIYLDSTLILQMDATAMGVYLSANGYPGVGVESTFRFWHIYPVMIPAGIHILQLIGNNVSSIASLGTEVYNNTAAQISTATGYSDLNLVFSSKNYIGSPIEIGNQGAGYTCPAGYALNLCGSPVVCVKTFTAPLIY